MNCLKASHPGDLSPNHQVYEWLFVTRCHSLLSCNWEWKRCTNLTDSGWRRSGASWISVPLNNRNELDVCFLSPGLDSFPESFYRHWLIWWHQKRGTLIQDGTKRLCQFPQLIYRFFFKRTVFLKYIQQHCDLQSLIFSLCNPFKQPVSELRSLMTHFD